MINHVSRKRIVQAIFLDQIGPLVAKKSHDKNI